MLVNYMIIDFYYIYQKVLFVFFSPILPGFQLLRDTFAGKNLREIWRRETDSEKVQIFYRQKCRADIPGFSVAHRLLLIDMN